VLTHGLASLGEGVENQTVAVLLKVKTKLSHMKQHLQTQTK
jgi:hypothetical protein